MFCHQIIFERCSWHVKASSDACMWMGRVKEKSPKLDVCREFDRLSLRERRY
jgi:hypothetical protein